MTLKERLRTVAGVWKGSYTHLTPDGRVLDRFPSRQEARLEGDRWYERIVYRAAEPGEQILDFRAVFDPAGDRLLYDDPAFVGEAFLLDETVLVMPYCWKDQPDKRVVEMVTFVDADHKSRVWQTFEKGELARITVIDERRVPETPVAWY